MNKKTTELKAFCQELMGLMPQLMRGFARYEHHLMIHGTITPAQFWGLEYVLSRNGCPMKDVAQYLGITKPSATALIDRLISQGLVVRQADAQDRRIVRIALSARGRSLTETIRQQRFRALGRVFGRISKSDRQEYLRILKEIGGVLKDSGRAPDTQ